MLPMCRGMVLLAGPSVLKWCQTRQYYQSHVILCIFGALAYADDLALLAPSANAMLTLLKICDDYFKQYLIVFNAAKSACLLVTSSKSQQRRMQKPQFHIGDKLTDFVNEYAHL